ncbi:hypothetical protein BJ508DRAFT_418509 [Ascobolus immersus RN42]|uniref:Uncharacterized protein n=1 Tax=Ascobolus immersus RN42 TaxID=1160509 RepID=A0A3N4HQ67_ASCIM|nr:hypothetical protein BJ508DRAFT_418509 [Ascobolus immersus RN42]
MSSAHDSHNDDEESDSDEKLLLAETLKQSRLAAGLPASGGADDEETLKRALEASMKEGYSPEVLEKMMQEDIQKALEESRKDKAYQERFRYRALAAGLRQSKKDGGEGPAMVSGAIAPGIAPAPAAAAAPAASAAPADDDDDEEEEEEDEEDAGPAGAAGDDDGEDDYDDDEDDDANSGDEDDDGPPPKK